jgi:hypothetical protein
MLFLSFNPDNNFSRRWSIGKMALYVKEIKMPKSTFFILNFDFTKALYPD